MKEMCEYLEKLGSTDYTSERDFTGEVNKWCYNKYMNTQMTLLSGRLIGTIDAKNEPIIIDNLLSERYIHFDPNCCGIFIPADEILSRSKFAWFARQSIEQVVQGGSILAKHFVIS